MSLDTVIKLENASIYQEENLILSEVNLELNKGEFAFLIGKTGSGKSSILQTLYAELKLTEGEGKVDEYDLRKITQNEIPFLRRKLGIVFQDFQLLTDRTIHDNLLFVLKATGWKNKIDIETRIIEVLEKVKLADKINKIPNQLSGGEQQRIVIARALLNNPDIIIADEPTGNLDPETSENIMQILFDIKKSGRAILMATHNYNILKKYPEKTFKCEDGKLLTINNNEEIDMSILD
jgi:cell division transport system ATP-binding protein